MKDMFDTITSDYKLIPLDFLPEIEDHNDPCTLAMQHEEEIIEYFGVNLVGHTL